jgi:hypothetical protein
VAVIGGVVFGLFMTWFVSRQRERYGGADRMLTLAGALEKGRLPEDADPEAWRAVLDRQERTMRRLRRGGPVELAAFAALDITFALTQTSVGVPRLLRRHLRAVAGHAATAAGADRTPPRSAARALALTGTSPLRQLPLGSAAWDRRGAW